MARLARFLFGLGLGLLAQGAPAFAQSGALPDAAPKVQASFIAEHGAVTPGGKVTVALRELIRENWHTYWVNPGDSGAPTIINWQLPEGWTAAAPQFPYPERIPVGPLMNFGYENEVVLLSEITAPANAAPGQTVMLEADVMWLVCSDVCIPEETHLSLPLPVAADAPPPSAENAELFAAARTKLPHASPWKARYEASDTRFGLLLEAPGAGVGAPEERGVLSVHGWNGPAGRAARRGHGIFRSRAALRTRLEDDDRREALGRRQHQGHPRAHGCRRTRGRARSRGRAGTGSRRRRGARGRVRSRASHRDAVRGAGRPHPQSDALCVPGAVDEGARTCRQARCA